MNGTGIASLASPTSGVCAETISSPSQKLRRSGAFFCASRLIRRTTSVSSARGQAQLVLDRLGQQLAVVGELTVDQARGEHGVAELEDDLVLRRRSTASASASRLLGDPHELLQRARRHVRLEAAAAAALERGLLDAQAVGVGRDHPQLLLGGRHQDAGQHRPRLVARGRARDARDGLDEGLGRERQRASPARAREVREVLGAQRAQVERRRAGDQLDVLLGAAQLERRAARPGSERATSSSSRAGSTALAGLLRSRPVSGKRRPTSMSVARSSALVLVGGDQHAGERLARRCASRRRGCGLQLVEQLVRGKRKASSTDLGI